MAETVQGTTESLSPDGGLEKTVLRAGKGAPAGRGARVSLRYSMRLASAAAHDMFDSSSKRRNGLLEFTVGRGRVIPAMERIAESMALDEECEVTCAPKHAFGSAGLKRKNVPSNATIVIRAEMVGFDGGAKPQKAFSEMSASERFSRAEHFKEIGNRLFKEHKFEKAVEEYTNAIRCIAAVFHQPMERPRSVTKAASTPAPKPSDVEAEAAELIPTSKSADADAPADAPVSTTEAADSSSPSSEQVPSSDVADANAVPAVLANGSGESKTEEMGTMDDSGFQEAEIVVDATIDVSDPQAPTTSVEPNVVEAPMNSADTIPESPKAADGEKKEDDASPTEDQVLELHVRTLNNLSLCCIKLGVHSSAEEGASLAIRMDNKNFKAFYYRFVYGADQVFCALVGLLFLADNILSALCEADERAPPRGSLKKRAAI